MDIRHASGSTAEVYEFGATLTSYVHGGRETIFCGDKAIFNGQKAIRGGAPLVFPQFGQPDKAMAQHGFLRNSSWSVDKERTLVREDSVVQVAFVIRSSDETRNAYPHDFLAEYTVSLGADCLITSLRTTNNDSAGEVSPMLLLHTYYSVPDIHSAQLKSLSGVKYVDKAPIEGAPDSGVEAEEALQFSRKCDKVYHTGSGVQAGAKPLQITLLAAPGAELLELQLGAALHKRSGDPLAVDVLPVTPDVVVWNPWVDMARDFADMNDEDYQVMVCIEPGLLGDNRPSVAAGDSVELTQKITPRW